MFLRRTKSFQAIAPLCTILAVLFAALLAPGILRAQIVNPADAQKPPPAPVKEAKEGATGAPSKAAASEPEPERLRSWELPAIDVVGQAAPRFKEEERVGSYGQPRWTADRRFPGTRVYVVPEGKVEFEYWLRPTIPRNGEPTEVRSLWELEFGLPYRFQLDLYLRSDQGGEDSKGDKGPMEMGQQVELRYALADWGVLPGNPTLYFEWVGLENRSDKVEPKLLFGGEIAPRVHWGLNLVAELELGSEREYEYSVTAGLSYAVIDSKFSIGAEIIAAVTDTKENRGTYRGTDEVVIGPSIQFHPLHAMTINFAPLFGVTGNSEAAKIFINLGWEF